MKTRSSDIQARFVEFCSINGLFAGRSAVLAAVSGGADSMVMLHLLKRCGAALGVAVAAGHVDHGIRPGSAEDASFVRRQAEALGVPFFGTKVDVPAEAKESGLSLEAAGRRARYRELARLAAEAGADVTATGHTMTDQAETLLMRLIRGTGPLGLAGISTLTENGVARPLLCISRMEVREFAGVEGIEFVEDETNSDQYFLRNRIRARLLPLLLEFNPRMEDLLSGLAEDAHQLTAAVDGLVDGMLRQTGRGWMVLRNGRLPGALMPYAIREAFRRVTGEPLGLSRTHIEMLTPMLDSYDGPAEAHLPRRVVARSNREGLTFEIDNEGPPPGSARRRR